jgi:hypothetical protein
MADLEEVAHDALREMYSRAEPPLDFDHAAENPEEYEDEWYQNHYLPHDEQVEIVDAHCDMHNLNSRERLQVTMTALLNLGPTSNEEHVNND